MTLPETVTLIDLARRERGWTVSDLCRVAGWSRPCWRNLTTHPTKCRIAALFDFAQAVGMHDIYVEF